MASVSNTEFQFTAGPPVSMVLLVFGSGFAGLVYQVLWIRDLGLLFGNTAQASATILTAFFLGIALGSFWFGRRAQRFGRPLRMYAVLEFAIAASALLYFAVLPVWQFMYPQLAAWIVDRPPLVVTVKFFMALVLLCPTAFFMGGTLPVISQHLIPDQRLLGRRGSHLYAVNTFGAACGALLAAFVLARLFGFHGAYLSAVFVSCLVGSTAWLLAARSVPSAAIRAGKDHGEFREPLIPILAFFSGCTALALEVLWTRMFVQVLHNSVQTFSVILVAFLLALSLGAVIAGRLARMPAEAGRVLQSILLVSAVAVTLSPLFFYFMTGGLRYFGGDAGWWKYLFHVFVAATVTIGAPAAILGCLFPYLLKASERNSTWSSGSVVGQLVGLNTVGAIVGSVTAGFLLLETLGLWHSIWAIAAVYLILAALWWGLRDRRLSAPMLAQAVTALLLVVVVIRADLHPVRIDTERKGEQLLEIWQGSAATVAVIEQPEGRKIKVNNHYALGGTAAVHLEWMQTDIPMYLHPAPESVLFLGMGTGITAGRALVHPIEEVVVAEIVPEVVTASRKYFSKHSGELFQDERATILAEDGRNALAVLDRRFDIIIGDLFIPWKAGVASMYSREHFQNAASRLNENGLFAQWLPLYQMSSAEFNVIARTMMEVFPHVSVWRGDFFARQPVVALIGHLQQPVLEPETLVRRLAGGARAGAVAPGHHALLGGFLLYYCGSLHTVGKELQTAPINTDNRPVIEYLAPRTQRRVKAGQADWFVGQQLLDFFTRLQQRLPPADDPYLARLEPRTRAYVKAGLALYKAQVSEDPVRAREARRVYERIVQGDVFGKKTDLFHQINLSSTHLIGKKR